MPTKEQKDNLRRLQAELTTRPDVGPVDGPKVGALCLCRDNQPCWFIDTTTLEMAVKLAKKSDHRCRSRFSIMGIPVGRPTKDPIADHYGLTPEQAKRIVEIDFMPLPETRNGGRAVWLERQTSFLEELISADDPTAAIATNRDPEVKLEVKVEEALHHPAREMTDATPRR